MQVVSSFAQKLLNPEVLREQEPVKPMHAPVGPVLMAAMAFTATASQASIEIRNDPASSKPNLVSGYTLDPSENLIQNGDFSEYEMQGSTLYTFNNWTYSGSLDAPNYIQSLSYEDRTFLTTYGAAGRILSVNETPEFDLYGLLSNDLTIESNYLSGWSQSFATSVGQQYIIQFDLAGLGFDERVTYVEGIAGVMITGYDPVILKVELGVSNTYQLAFMAASSESVLTFLDFGVAQRYYSSNKVEGWDMPSDGYTASPAWDNVSVDAIPEPSYFTSAIALMALGYAFRQTAKRRRQR